jgi:hypothetical protein
MLRSSGLTDSAARAVCIGSGMVEIAIGLTLILAWHSRWPLWLTLVAMPTALLAVAIKAPQFLVSPFNAVVVNVAVFALAALAFLAAGDGPSAARCLRRPTRGEP